MEGEAPLSFEDVDLVHGYLQQTDPFFSKMDLPPFSRYMNRELGTSKYSAGETGPVGRVIKRVSGGLDQVLRPISEKTGEIGAGIGGIFGETGGEIGRTVGEHLPRTLGQVASLATPYTAPIGLADVFAQTYTQTGSPLVGGISAATFGLAPIVGGKAAAALAPRIASRGYSPLLERTAEKAAST